MTSEFLTVNEAAQLAEVHRRTVYRWLEERRLQPYATRFKRRTMIRRDELEHLLHDVTPLEEPEAALR